MTKGRYADTALFLLADERRMRGKDESGDCAGVSGAFNGKSTL